MRRLGPAGLSSLLALAGCNSTPTYEAGVGSSIEGCGLEGTHSEVVGEHSCACEPGYAWCSDDPNDFDCCPDPTSETGETGEGLPPEDSCTEASAEALRCVPDPDDPDDPSLATVWACNGSDWVPVPGYADFACMAEGKAFAYGCAPGPEFLCGYGPGSTCEIAEFGSICVDEDIIDTCVWGRRTIDRCSRLCTELELHGPGFAGGVCIEIPDQPAVCICT